MEAAEISAHKVMAEAYQFYPNMKVSTVKGILACRLPKFDERSRITYVPSDGKSKSIIDVSGTELRNRSREREPGRHFTQALHHTKHGNASK
jgi:hypothetical protein